jgi:hypothetical protein
VGTPELISALNSRYAGIDSIGISNPSYRMRLGVRLVIWDLVYTKQAQKDARKLAASNLRDKAQALLEILRFSEGKLIIFLKRLDAEITLHIRDRSLTRAQHSSSTIISDIPSPVHQRLDSQYLRAFCLYQQLSLM